MTTSRRLLGWARAAALLIGATTVLALGMLALWPQVSSDRSPVEIVLTVPQAAGEPQAASDTAPGAPASAVGATSDGAGGGATGSAVQTARPRPPAHPDTGLRIRIPALSVDTKIVELGFNEDGQLDVPANGRDVGWYNISALPGSPGNALLGGHLDWAGSAAVFSRLRDLSEGDLVYIDTGGGELVYRVESAYVVTFDAPLGDVLGERSGPGTITLFTCGGGFDAARREYEERVIVRAAALPSSTLALH